VSEVPPYLTENAADSAFARERFFMRAQALFYARIALLAIGLCLLLVPAWRTAFHVDSTGTITVYLLMVSYSAANYVVLGRERLGAVITYITLCFDLGALVYLTVVSGGLHSPLLPTELLFTVLFVMLFPRPIAIVPPLLTFPIVAKIQEILTDGFFLTEDLFLLVWYSLINCIMVYVIVYLHSRDEMKHQEIMRLQRSLKDLAVAEERTRLAREIHDGLGGSLSSLILQAEYLQGLARDEPMRSEIAELKMQAEESIDELRRSLTMMRDDFDLVRGVEDACRKFEARSRGLTVTFVRVGREKTISSEAALTLFRVLQESLANVARHARATRATVTLRFSETECELSVHDDGQGFDCSARPPPGHYGLLNMGERAQRIGGVARVESTPGAGTIISLAVPLAMPALPLSTFPAQAA
jgi:two-component system sensor histidine kinase DegS